MLNRIVILSLALILTFPALAQEREYKPGINTVTIKNNIKAKEPEKPETPKPVRPDITARSKEEVEKKREEDEGLSPAQRIWNKYEKLATGTAEEDSKEEENEKANPPPEVEKVDENEEAKNEETDEEEQQTKNSGMRGLIDQYQKNKEQQKQMRTITYQVPEIKQEDKRQ